MSQELQIDITKGEFLPVDFPVTREDTGAAFDLTNYDAFVTVADIVCPDIELISLSAAGGRVTIPNPTDGIIKTSFLPGDTTPLAIRKYRYDVWIEHKTEATDKRPVIRNQTFNLEGSVRKFP